MEIKEAQQEAEKLILHYGDYWEPLSMLARLVEEVGELSRAMNIKYGGKKSKFAGDGREIEKELSDVLFTVLAIADSQKIDLEKEFSEKIKHDYEKMKGVYIK
ncbi:nucleotide pyrophosphohydrolase [Candidatus Pacearchaeota archaeon]|jgi:NTP pyrophosphatase (non-canonical NTP hydrolase)|nr:nucleotide pyrophosphohydrolase [Candidatus Pacearchaeota archaeon]